VEHVVLREKKIGNCAGDFYCWIRTPVTFGGYSSALKRMVDHQIQNISPFFAKVEGETHHQKRYEAYPDFLAIGWMDVPDAQAETVFRHLAQHNAINFCAETCISGVVLADQSDREILSAVQL